jgi:hypothetical protein
MPTVEVTKGHSLELSEAQGRMRTLAESFQSDYPGIVSEVKWGADGLSATAKGKGFTATFLLSENKMTARVELSMLLGAIKGRVRSRLEQKLEEAVGF